MTTSLFFILIGIILILFWVIFTLYNHTKRIGLLEKKDDKIAQKFTSYLAELDAKNERLGNNNYKLREEIKKLKSR